MGKVLQAKLREQEASKFVAGTPVLTAAGLVAIECIRAGDRLVHLTVSSEELITTVDHPFYVKEYGFTSAGGLCVGDRLVDAGGNALAVEAINQELVGEPVTVYNFQVEGFHTYYAGALSVLVHNANYPEGVRGRQRQKPILLLWLQLMLGHIRKVQL